MSKILLILLFPICTLAQSKKDSSRFILSGTSRYYSIIVAGPCGEVARIDGDSSLVIIDSLATIKILMRDALSHGRGKIGPARLDSLLTIKCKP